MKQVTFRLRAGIVFKEGETIVCDDKTANRFGEAVTMTEYVIESQKVETAGKKKKEVNEYGE